MSNLEEAKRLAREMSRWEYGPEWISSFDKLSLVKDSLSEAEKALLEDYLERLADGSESPEEIHPEAPDWMALYFVGMFLVLAVGAIIILGGN